MPPINLDLGDLIRQLDDDLPEADVLAKVSEARDRSRDLAGLGDRLVDHYIQLARAGGASWSQVGDALGVSKQAAQQRGSGGRFERFTKRAAQATGAAAVLARRHGADRVDVDHVVLALLGEVEGLAAKVVAGLAGPLETVTAKVQEAVPVVGEPRERAGHMVFTDAAKRTLDLTMRAAQEMGHHYIGTEHILLGALQVTESRAVSALNELGVDHARAKIAVTSALIGYQHRKR
jgi:hypothetical protein